MENKYIHQRNISYKQSCNNYCCPANLDDIGRCYADEYTEMACDFNAEEFNDILNNCYDAMVRSFKTKDISEYEELCNKFFNFIDKKYKK